MANKEKGTNVKTKKVIKVKNVILFVLLCLLIIFLLIFAFNTKKEKPVSEKVTYNKNDNFLKEQNVDGILFKDIECSYDGKDSLIKYVIVNNTDEEIYLSNYDIVVQDKNKNHLIRIVAGFEQNLEPKEEVKRSSSVVGIDLSDAYYMELKLKTEDK